MFFILSAVFLVACAPLGKAAVFESGRIVGGNLADTAEYPSQVSLRALGSHACGATIISENWVLTAAHCVTGTHPTLLKVHANSNHLITNGTLHEVASFIIHTGFNSSDFTSEDIALVEVLEPFVFGETAQPATLPAQDEATPGGSTATSIGWGFVDSNGPTSPNLQEVELVVRSYQECYDIYSVDVPITEAQLCADVPEGGKGVCLGDSGGPLFVDGKIAGVVSWSANGCASEGFPGVYTRVASYREWITEHCGV